METSQFFGETGLTSTSATHVCNLAKEWYSNVETELENIRFFSTSMQLIGTDIETIINKASELKLFNSIPEKLQEIAEAKSLIAWLREAVKAKEELNNSVKRISLSDYCEILNIEYPKEPPCIKALTELEYYNSLSIKDRNRYYSLETACAVLGKFIHEKGAFNKARKELSKIIQNPITVKGEGRDAIVYKNNPLYLTSETDEMYFKLQQKHREYQAELNGMKHNCEKAVNESLAKCESEFDAKYKEYRMKMVELTNQMNQYKLERRKEVQDLKIIIPNSLKSIYEKINSLGK